MKSAFDHHFIPTLGYALETRLARQNVVVCVNLFIFGVAQVDSLFQTINILLILSFTTNDLLLSIIMAYFYVEHATCRDVKNNLISIALE